MSTKIFLDNASVSKMYCIDPWIGGYDENDGASFSNMDEVEAEFDERIYTKYTNVIKIKELSVDACEQFEDEFFDVVYIDGDHTYNGVMSDIRSYLPKVKHGGLLCGHDYWDSGLVAPKQAVDDVFGKPDMVFSDGSWMIRVI